MGACGFERDLVYSRSSLFIFFYLDPTNMESNFLRRSWLFWEGAIILGCCGARKSAGNPLPPPTLCDMSVCMCPYMHDQYPLSTFPLVPSGGVDSLHTQVSHLLLCCHVTHYSECVRACVCLSVSSLSMHVRSRGGVPARPPTGMFPSRAGCTLGEEEPPEESAQMSGGCCVLKRIMTDAT